MSSSPEYTLYYHNCAGRGEFIRIIFEEMGVKYTEVNDPAEVMKISQGAMECFPSFAPPLLKHHELTLSQTSVICRYLGKQFDLWPQNEVDEWHAEQLNTTIHDFIGEGRLAFHGAGFVKSYYQQQEETKPYIAWFIADRLEKRWLKHLEQALATNNGGQGFLVGNKLTYVDMALLHVLRATAFQFAEEWDKINSVPLLKAFKERMEARPNLAAYFKSDRCKPFEGNSMM